MYVAVLDSDNPSKAKVSVLESGEISIGSILLVSNLDFARQGIASILTKTFPEQFRILEKTENGNLIYYNLPVFKGFIFDSSEPGEFPKPKTIYFPADVLGHKLEMDLIKSDMFSENFEPEKNNWSFGLESFSIPFIDFAYDQYPETIPWEAVQVQQGQEAQTLSYAAALDRSLEFFAVGKTEEGLNGLEAAASFVPAQNLEGARLAVLKLAFVQLSLTGNVGELQSLPFLHKAYDLFLQSRSDPRFSEKDPLTNWLRQMLCGSYTDLDWSLVFLDRVSVLNAIPHMDDDRKPYTEVLKNSLEGKSYEELLKILQTRNYSSAELHFIRYIVICNYIQQWIGSISQTVRDAQSEKIQIAKNTEEANKLIPIMHFFDASLARKGGLQTSPEMELFIEFMANEWPKIENTMNNDDIKKLLILDAKKFPMMNIMFSPMLEIETKKFQEPMNSQWWRTDYLNWFAFWSLNAAEEINQHDYPWKASDPPDFSDLNVRKLVSKYGNDYLIKDMGGKGRTFLPGLFFLAWYSQTFGLDDAGNLKDQFEAEAQMPFDVYRSKLFVVNGTTNEQMQLH